MMIRFVTIPFPLFARPLLRARIYTFVQVAYMHRHAPDLFGLALQNLQKFDQSTMYASIIHHDDHPPLVNRSVSFQRLTLPERN